MVNGGSVIDKLTEGVINAGKKLLLVVRTERSPQCKLMQCFQRRIARDTDDICH